MKQNIFQDGKSTNTRQELPVQLLSMSYIKEMY